MYAIIIRDTVPFVKINSMEVRMWPFSVIIAFNVFVQLVDAAVSYRLDNGRLFRMAPLPFVIKVNLGTMIIPSVLVAKAGIVEQSTPFLSSYHCNDSSGRKYVPWGNILRHNVDVPSR